MKTRSKLALISLVLLLFIGLGWYWKFLSEVQAPVRIASVKARESFDIDRVVGRSFQVGHIVTGRVFSSGGNGTADLNIRISGPNGQGRLQEWAQETQERWQICSLTFQSNSGSETIQIVPDDSMHCERE